MGPKNSPPTPGSILSQLRAARLTLSGYTARASPSKGRLMRYTVPGSTLNTSQGIRFCKAPDRTQI
jgi:hypothetical protein